MQLLAQFSDIEFNLLKGQQTLFILTAISWVAAITFTLLSLSNVRAIKGGAAKEQALDAWVASLSLEVGKIESKSSLGAGWSAAALFFLVTALAFPSLLQFMKSLFGVF